MTDILLVRHAQCDHVGRRLVGRLPGIALNDDGRRQAARLGAALAARPLHAVYSSPLERAIETAQAIAGPHRLAVRTRSALTDLDFGEWTGATLGELNDDPRWHAFNQQRSSAAAPGGEHMSDVQARAVAELMGCARLHGGERIVLVSHADIIRSVILHLLGMPIDSIHRIEVEPASVTHVQIDGTFARLIALNALGGSAALAAADAQEIRSP